MSAVLIKPRKVFVVVVSEIWNKIKPEDSGTEVSSIRKKMAKSVVADIERLSQRSLHVL